MPSPARTNKRDKKTQGGLTMIKVEALTNTQDTVFDQFNKGQHLNLHGYAGTGKTFLALYLALKAVERGEYKKVVIFRSPISAVKIGFLPGSEKEKMAIYASPYISICNQLYNRGDAWSILEQHGTIEFNSTAFERGNTYDDSIIVVDEWQNMGWNELNTINTRVGENTRLIFCGDHRQTDLRFEDERAGHKIFYTILKTMEDVSCIEFTVDDIVRSGWCRSWIEASMKYEDDTRTSLTSLI